MRFAVVIVLLFCGCVRVPQPSPGPDVVPVAGGEMNRWLESLRETTWKALDDTERAVLSSQADDEALYRKALGSNLEMAARAARVELSRNDQAMSDSGYTREKALEILDRRKRELRRGQ